MNIDFVTMLIEANIAVQILMVILLSISIKSWAIIFQKNRLLNQNKKTFHHFEDYFWNNKINIQEFYNELIENTTNIGIENIFVYGFAEFKKIFGKQHSRTDVANTIINVQRAMHISINREEEILNKDISLLASIGSVSPYIGLLGTIIGIIDAFVAIGNSSSQLSLSSVAPAISEALIATGLGLFAAIPAVWAYNNYTSRINFLMAEYETFADEFINILQRKLTKSNAN